MGHIDNTALLRCKPLPPFDAELQRIWHTLTTMRLIQTLLRLLLLAAVAFNLGGGMQALPVMADHAPPPATVPADAAPHAMPCHGDTAGPSIPATQHRHGDADCGASGCDCGCALSSAMPPMPRMAPASLAPSRRYLASHHRHIPDQFSHPRLRPPISIG